MTHPFQEADRGGENPPVRKAQGGRNIPNDLIIKEMDQTILEKAKTEAVAPESKEEEDVVLTQSRKGIEVVVMKGIEAPQDTAETHHHPTHIMKHRKGVTVRIVGVGIVKVAGLGI